MTRSDVDCDLRRSAPADGRSSRFVSEDVPNSDRAEQALVSAVIVSSNCRWQATSCRSSIPSLPIWSIATEASRARWLKCIAFLLGLQAHHHIQGSSRRAATFARSRSHLPTGMRKAKRIILVFHVDCHPNSPTILVASGDTSVSSRWNDGLYSYTVILVP